MLGLTRYGRTVSDQITVLKNYLCSTEPTTLSSLVIILSTQKRRSYLSHVDISLCFKLTVRLGNCVIVEQSANLKVMGNCSCCFIVSFSVSFVLQKNGS